MIDIMEKLKELLSEKVVGAAGIEITEDTTLRRELGLDSLRLVSVLVSIEELFDIVFDESDLDPGALRKVGDLIRLIKKSKIEWNK